MIVVWCVSVLYWMCVEWCMHVWMSIHVCVCDVHCVSGSCVIILPVLNFVLVCPHRAVPCVWMYSGVCICSLVYAGVFSCTLVYLDSGSYNQVHNNQMYLGVFSCIQSYIGTHKCSQTHACIARCIQVCAGIYRCNQLNARCFFFT